MNSFVLLVNCEDCRPGGIQIVRVGNGGETYVRHVIFDLKNGRMRQKIYAWKEVGLK